MASPPIDTFERSQEYRYEVFVKEGRRPRVLVTRSARQASALGEALRVRGVEPVFAATIEIVPAEDSRPLEAALERLRGGGFEWLVLTSANAVASLQGRLAALPEGVRVAAIGRATARVAEAAGWHVDLVPERAVAESLAEALLPFARRGERFLLVRAAEGREVVPETLRGAGGEVVVAPAYRTVAPQGTGEALRKILREGVAAVTFTSSSSVRNLFDLLDAEGLKLPPEALRASIGPVTSAELQARGERVDIEAPTASVESLAEVTAANLLV